MFNYEEPLIPKHINKIIVINKEQHDYNTRHGRSRLLSVGR